MKLTTQEILEVNPRHGFKSRRAYTDYVKLEIQRAMELPIEAQYYGDGNCTICGESGRCPGWHTKHDA